MKRPALWSALFLILGILLGRYGFKLSGTVLFSLVLVIAAVKIAKAKSLIMLVIFAAAGFGLMRNAMNFGTNNLDVSADIREEISIKGIV